MRDTDEDLRAARVKTLRRVAALLTYAGVMIVAISVAFGFTHYAPEEGTGMAGVAAGILVMLAGVGLGVYTFMRR
jgi:polyferredoxin